MDTAVTSAPPCALCASRERRQRYVVSGAPIVECTACGLVTQHGRRAHALVYDESYYSNDRPKGGYRNYFRDAGINRRTFAARLTRIAERLGRRGRLLDVGCALGDFVLEATRRGWSAEGLEVSEHAAREARRRGALVHLGPLGPATVRTSSYDVITLYDTLEHTADPVGMLSEAARTLVPDGLVHIVTPNVDGLQARWFGRRWYHYKPDEHLVYFGPRTLERAVGAAGLEWAGWSPTGSYVTVAYVLDRLRVYAGPLELLARMSERVGVGSIAFYLHVGEMEAWARRPRSRT